MQAGQAGAAAEDSEQHSSESDLTPSGRYQQQQVAFCWFLSCLEACDHVNVDVSTPG